MSSINLSNDLECLSLEALCTLPEVTREIGTIPKVFKSGTVKLATGKTVAEEEGGTVLSNLGKKRRNRCRRRRTLEDDKAIKTGDEKDKSAEANSRVQDLPELESLYGDEIIQALKNHNDAVKPDAIPSSSVGKKSRRRRGGNKRKQHISPDSKVSNDKENNKKVEGPKSSSDEDDDDEDDRGGVSSSSNRKFLWRNVTKNGWIKKCILVDGQEEGGRPKAGDTVLVKSQGKLKDGRIIDDFPTLVFNVGEHEVIEGLDVAVQSMHKNELSILSVKPEMAYGQLGRKNDVPTGARITYLFGLLHFEKQKELSQLTWAQRRKSGQSRMRLANWWYQRKEYPVAVKCYKKALEYYNNIPTNQECSTPEEYKELLQLMEERLRVMRQVANIFKRIANMIQSGQINT